MKKLTLVSLLGCLTISLYSQIKVHSGGKVGIGTADTPLYNVDIKGSGSEVALRIKHTNEEVSTWGVTLAQDEEKNGWLKCSGRDLTIVSGYNKKLILGSTSHDTYNGKVIIPGGKVGIGIDNPQYKLDIDGDVASSGVVLTSDERLKKNIATLTLNVEKLKQVKGVSYELKKTSSVPIIIDSTANLAPASKTDSLGIGGTTRKTRYGVLAQEVKEVFPELVDQRENGYYNVDYIGLIPVLIEAIKEQQEMIDEMQEQIDELRKQAGLKTALIDYPSNAGNTQ